VTDRAAEPAPQLAQPTWGLWDVAVGVLAGFVLSQVVGAIVLGITNRTADQADDLPLGWLLVAQLGLWCGLLSVPVIATRVKGNGFVDDLRLRVRRRDLWVGGAVGVAMQLVVLPLIYWPLLWLLDKSASDLDGPARQLTDRADGVGNVALLVLIAAIAAPLVEELFYRGFLQRALLKRGLPPAVAIGVSAFVFAGSHFEALQLPGLLAFGIAAGVLTYRSGRLGPAIVAHMVFNLVVVVAQVGGS
jgi:hypothetical protein